MGPCSTLVALLVLGQLLNYLVQLSRVQALTAGEASIKMWQRHQNDELPQQVRGVLWMRGNTCPELQLTLEAGAYDKTRRTLLLPFGTAYSWSYNSDLASLWEYAAVTLNLAFFSPGKLRVEFDEDFRSATMQITLAGISLAEAAGLWALNQTDDSGHFWQRMQWNATTGEWNFVYDLRKVLTADGKKLQAWSEMVHSTVSAAVVRGDGCGGTMVKTDVQLLHGDFSVLQTFLTIFFAAFWLTLARYCFSSNGAKVHSAEYEPLSCQPRNMAESLLLMLKPELSTADCLLMQADDLRAPVDPAGV